MASQCQPGNALTMLRSLDTQESNARVTDVFALKHEGLNRVQFVAQDMAGNETRVERTASVDAY